MYYSQENKSGAAAQQSAAIKQTVTKHVEHAELLSDAGSEMSFRLPMNAAAVSQRA